MQARGLIEERLWEELKQFLKEHLDATTLLYGFGHSKFTAKHIGLTKTIMVIHDHPEQALKALGSTSFLDNSKYASAIIESHEPFFWHLAPFAPDLTPQQRRQLEINSQNKMDVGLSLSLPFDNGRGFGGLGICCADSRPDDLVERWTKNSSNIEAYVKNFDATMRPLMVANRIKLSKREKDMLAYSAGGLTAKEIAAHLNIQTKTVYNTLERARKSMKAATTLEAVAKAYMYNLI
jgi:LuxR family transcriptional regulator, quorum-sensing system regulator SdiA